MLKFECCSSAGHTMDELDLGGFCMYKDLKGLDCTFPEFVPSHKHIHLTNEGYVRLSEEMFMLGALYCLLFTICYLLMRFLCDPLTQVSALTTQSGGSMSY